MEGAVLKIFWCLLFKGFTFAVGQAEYTGEAGPPPPFSGYPSTVYNPVNSITVNACCNRSEEFEKLEQQMTELNEALKSLISELQNGDFCSSDETADIVGADCYEIQQKGESTSKIYTIQPENSTSFDVYCDMDTDGGGWTVFQKRIDDTTDFYLNWEKYKEGFGLLTTNYWLGNEHLYHLTNQKAYSLRVDLGDFEDNTRYAVYDYFRISGEERKYTLSIGTYSGDAGDAMARCNGQRFSTRDDENGNGCTALYKGGWWYAQCHDANLNGLYLGGSHTSFADGIEWNQWRGYYYSLKFTEMKLRPNNRF